MMYSRNHHNISLASCDDFKIIKTKKQPILSYHDHIYPIDNIWQENVNIFWDNHVKINPNLFDAPIVITMVDNVLNSDIIDVTTINYRHVYAKHHAIDSHHAPKFCSIGVAAILSCHDGIIIGKRHKNSALLPSYWEFMPAGGVDNNHMNKKNNIIHPEDTILQELHEELCVIPIHHISYNFMAIVQYHYKPMVEFLYRIMLDMPFQTIRNKAILPEHDDIMLLDMNHNNLHHITQQPMVPLLHQFIQQKLSQSQNHRGVN